MMKMVSDINGVHLAKLGRDDITTVRCITCHHGVTTPETIDSIVLSVTRKDGLDAALEKYRELRAGYYGSGSYDFTASPLNEVAETLAQERNDVAGGITVAKMNLELNPDNARTYLLLGQLYQAAGDRAAAIAHVEKSLELDPGNRWAKGMLEKLKAAE
jgi:tetratricopeptide (TPR) repeat protein